jgi:WD40 repeat protein
MTEKGDVVGRQRSGAHGRGWGLALLCGLSCLPIVSFSLPVTMKVVVSRLPVDAAQRVDSALPTDPQLRMETFSHIGWIGSIATDSAGRWLVTSGLDKTARVWAINSGDLQSVLRPPVGSGVVGEISRVALSPDGGTVAVSWRSEGSVAIFLFERASGRVLKRINGLIDSVSDLHFSSDGKLLAASIVSGAVQLFDVANGREWARDAAYGGDSYSSDFSPDGRLLVTTCSDGLMRLYALDAASTSMHLLGKADATAFLAKPITARFSPNGRLIAVGYDRGPTVQIWSPSPLTRAAVLGNGLVTANFPWLTWSADGNSLYGPGAFGEADYRIRRWSAGPELRGQPSFNVMSAHNDIPVKENGNVNALVSLPGGGVAFATAGPAWGVVSSNGIVIFRQQSPGALADSTLPASWPRNLRLSSDGRQVSFQYGSAHTVAVFDLAKRNWISGKTDLASPIVSASGVDVQFNNWMDSRKKAPTLNGKALQFDPGELTTSLAIAPDGKFVALGSIFSVRLFNRDGNMLWRNLLWVRNVNISADGKWVVAECGDGTLRWYHLADGKEVLVLYPQPDSQSWVMWTPSGYFDASPGSDNLIGWQVNRGPDRAAEFYPASGFSDVLRRPDILDKALDTSDEDEAVKRANVAADRKEKRVTPQTVAKILPPSLEKVSLDDQFSGDSVRIEFRVYTAPDAPEIGDPWVIVNGEGQPRSRAVTQIRPDGTRTLTVGRLPPHDSRVEIYARNANAPSEPLVYDLKWRGGDSNGQKGQGRAVQQQKPQLYLLAVGISQYQQSRLNLQYADQDAQKFVAAMRTQKGKEYSQVTDKLLINNQATVANVQAGLTWLATQRREGDVGMIFLAGHGIQAADQKYLFVAADFDPGRPRETGVDYKSIRDALENFSHFGNKAIYLIDTCHAEAAFGDNFRASNGSSFANELRRQEYGVVALAAAAADQSSWEDAKWGDGAFTKALLEGIVEAKAASDVTGEIKVLRLFSYVSERVHELTQDRQVQDPVVTLPLGSFKDFAVATH